MTANEIRFLEERITAFGERYEQDVDRFLGDEDGYVSAARERKKSWWKAQCHFRGLPTNGTISDLQIRISRRRRERDAVIKRTQDQLRERLRRAVNDVRRPAPHDDSKMSMQHNSAPSTAKQGPSKTTEEQMRKAGSDPPRATLSTSWDEQYTMWDKTGQMIKEIEAKEAQQRQETAARERNERWDRAQTDVEKAEIDTRRFLMETFFRHDKAAIPTHVVLRTYPYERKNLHTVAEELGLLHETVDDPTRRRGRRFQVRRCIIIGRGKEMKECVAQLTAEANQAVIDKEKARQDTYAAILAGARKQKEWDITGKFAIQSKDIQDFDARCEPDDLKLDIWLNRHSSRDHGARLPQYLARFNFGIVKGVMYLFPLSIEAPSSKVTDSKTVYECQYTWMGHDTGDGELCDFKRAYRMKFRDHGTTLKATFYGPGIGKCNFSGTKMIPGHRQAMSRDEVEHAEAVEGCQ